MRQVKIYINNHLIMNRIYTFIIICFFCFNVYAQIPNTSMDIIKRHYPRHKISHYEYTNKNHIVTLSNNTILKFKRNGELIEVNGYVPILIVPYQINNDLLWTYPHKRIHHYRKHKRGYDLRFKNGKQVRYNRRYKKIK